MSRADRNFGENDPEFRGPGLHGFAPGGDDFGVVRQIDGHDPFKGGIEGSNVHVPSAGDPGWHDPIGPAVNDSGD